MRILVVLYLLLSFSLPLSWSYKQITTRISPRSITKKKVCLYDTSFYDDINMVYAQAAVNTAIVAVLGVALYFQDKNQRETLAKNNKDFEETLARQDEAYRKAMADLKVLSDNNFGYDNLENIRKKH